mmetsp:Transcript_35232/g.99328  ORF Transcript_35232/g.99328 Transcript_35232/m.99328 type:complete len:201 (+) Transcript_35232:1210-1812(+)
MPSTPLIVLRRRPQQARQARHPAALRRSARGSGHSGRHAPPDARGSAPSTYAPSSTRSAASRYRKPRHPRTSAPAEPRPVTQACSTEHFMLSRYTARTMAICGHRLSTGGMTGAASSMGLSPYTPSAIMMAVPVPNNTTPYPTTPDMRLLGTNAERHEASATRERPQPMKSKNTTPPPVSEKKVMPMAFPASEKHATMAE